MKFIRNIVVLLFMLTQLSLAGMGHAIDDSGLKQHLIDNLNVGNENGVLKTVQQINNDLLFPERFEQDVQNAIFQKIFDESVINAAIKSNNFDLLCFILQIMGKKINDFVREVHGNDLQKILLGMPDYIEIKKQFGQLMNKDQLTEAIKLLLDKLPDYIRPLLDHTRYLINRLEIESPTIISQRQQHVLSDFFEGFTWEHIFYIYMEDLDGNVKGLIQAIRDKVSTIIDQQYSVQGMQELLAIKNDFIDQLLQALSKHVKNNAFMKNILSESIQQLFIPIIEKGMGQENFSCMYLGLFWLIDYFIDNNIYSSINNEGLNNLIKDINILMVRRESWLSESEQSRLRILLWKLSVNHALAELTDSNSATNKDNDLLMRLREINTIFIKQNFTSFQRARIVVRASAALSRHSFVSQKFYDQVVSFLSDNNLTEIAIGPFKLFDRLLDVMNRNNLVDFKKLFTENLDIIPFFVNEVDLKTNTLLINAVLQEKDIAWIQFLVDQGSNIDYQTASGNSALIAASIRARSEIVEYLLEHRADASIKDIYGNDALHYVSRDQAEMMYGNKMGAYKHIKNLLLKALKAKEKTFAHYSIDEQRYMLKELGAIISSLANKL